MCVRCALLCLPNSPISIGSKCKFTDQSESSFVYQYMHAHTHTAEEDTFGLYSRILLKYFLAEGVMCGHDIFVASAAEKPEHIVKVGSE